MHTSFPELKWRISIFQLDPKLTIILPDFKVQTVKSFLHLIYTGTVYVEDKAELVSSANILSKTQCD